MSVKKRLIQYTMKIYTNIFKTDCIHASKFQLHYYLLCLSQNIFVGVHAVIRWRKDALSFLEVMWNEKHCLEAKHALRN